MKEGTKLGMNKTGVQMSPIDMGRMMRETDKTRDDGANGAGIAAVRTSYITEADPVGTVPMPGTMKGMLKTGAKKITGNQPEVLVDKLGERLAFERSGIRLYDALLTKYQAMSQEVAGKISRDDLMHIRNEEAEHFALVGKAIESLGADPTAQTPSADMTGVESMGLMQVMDDPRTTLAQCLHAVLIAELADNAGWEMLIKLAEDMGQDDMAADFRQALQEEQEHLAMVTQWHDECVRQEMH